MAVFKHICHGALQKCAEYTHTMSSRMAAYAIVVTCVTFWPASLSAEAQLSLVPQFLEQAVDSDLTANNSKNASPVTAKELTTDLPMPGKYFQIAIRPGRGGYPGITILFNEPVDLSRHDALAVWFKSDTPVSFFQLVVNGADGVVSDHTLGLAAAMPAAIVQPGVWRRAFLFFKSEPGWVRHGKQMDWTRIKGVTFYTSDDMLSMNRAAYQFDVGGMTLYSASEAKAASAAITSRPAIATAARIRSNKDVRIWTASTCEKVFRDTPFPQRAPQTPAAAAKAAGHEYASLLWVVNPMRDLHGITAETGDLVSDTGRVSAANVTVRYVDYIEKPLFSHPDPLPLLNGKRLNAAKGENLLVWATAYVPSGTPKGTYYGDVVLKDAKGLSQRLPIQLDVYGFSLSRTTHLKSLFTIQHLYGGAKWLEDRSERYWGRRITPYSTDYKTVINNAIRDFGEHRITPDTHTTACQFLSDEDRLALQRRDGCDPIFVVAYNWANSYVNGDGTLRDVSLEERKGLVAGLRECGEKRMKAGVAALSVIKIADEPPLDPVLLKPVLVAAQDASIACPYIQKFLTITRPQLPESLFNLVDTWCPMWGVFHFESPQAVVRKSAGDRFWTYAGEYRSNDAYEPIDLRILYWLYWKYGVTGVHYSHHVHSYFLTYPNDSYPHSDGLESIPSIRWEMIRHGVQDHDYLWLLNDLIQKKGAKADIHRTLLTISKTLAVNDKEYSRDPRALLAQRDRIAHAIEELSSCGP